MKKLFTLFALLLCGMTAWAAEVTIDLSAQGYTNQQAVTSTTSGDVTLTYDQGTSSTAPAYYTTGTAVRVYNGGTMTVSCSAGNITQIVLTATANGSATLTASPGTLSDLTWTGSSSSVVFTVGTAKHYRFQKVTVTYEESATVKTPTISGETPFLGSTEVTIACATEGASIYYTTDGTDPTSASTAYSEAFTVSETTTVKAIAISGSDQSSIAEKTFTAIPTVATVAELNALENGTTFAFTGNAIVAYYIGKYLYIKDDTGSSLIYGTFSTEFTVGKTITPNWQGSVSIYKNLFEAVPSTTITETEADAVTVTYPEVEASAVTADNMNQVVTLTECTYTAASGKNFTITKDGTEIAGYNQFGITIDEPVDGKTYTIVGVISVYNTNVQFQPISITKTPEAVDITISPESGDIYEAYTAAVAEQVTGDDYVGKLTVNLAAGVEYTISGSLAATNSVVVKGDSSIIDASSLAAPFVQMLTLPTTGLNDKGFLVIDEVSFTDIVVKNLAYQLFYANKQKYIVSKLTVDNSIIGINGTNKKTIFDFNGGGNMLALTINNSTLWANPSNAQNGGFFSTQSSCKMNEVFNDGEEYSQTTTISNSTIYNIAHAKTTSSLRQNSQTWMTFAITNSIIAESGKSGQFLKGLNSGQAGNASGPVWNVENNTFIFSDAIVEEQTVGGSADNIKNSLATLPEFKDAANGDFTIGAGTQQAQKKTGDPRWLVEFSADSITQTIDVTITPESGADLSAAVEEESGGWPINNLTINTTEGASYTVTSTISAAGNITVAGADSLATIDASGLTGTMFASNDATTEWKNVTVKFANMKVTGLTQALFASTDKGELYDVTLDNSIVELGAGAKTTFDFTKGGIPTALTVSNSTVYAPTATTNSFISTERGQKPTECSDSTTSKFSFQNSTLYNVTYNKNFISHRTKGLANLAFDLQNCIVVNCGKANFLASLNGGQSSTAPTYTVGTNTIATLLDGTFTDLSESQSTVDGATYLTKDPKFADAANGDFTLHAGSQQAESKIGDPRWLVEYDETLGVEGITVDADAENGSVKGIYNLSGQKVNESYRGIVIKNGKKYIQR